MIDPQRVVLMRAEWLHDVEEKRRAAHDLAEELDDARHALTDVERRLAAFEEGVEHARATGRLVDSPCRGCGNAGLSTPAHVYGARKCCPDCDHRPVCTWCGRGENPGEDHRAMFGTLEGGEPSDFACLDADGRQLEHVPGPDPGGPPPF